MRKTILLLALFSLIVVTTSCQKPEEVTVSKYFQAMAHNDKDTMATMSYEPIDVEYKSFEILSIDEPTVGPLQLQALNKKLADANAAKKNQVMTVMDKTDELDDLEYELDETRRRSKRAELQKKIDELQTMVDEETQKVKTLQLEINQTKKDISREKALITLSTGFRDNLEMFEGQTSLNKVTAKITMENGDTKDYIFLLRSDTLKLEGKEKPGRLIILKISTLEDYQKAQQEKEAAVEEPAEEVTEPAPATEGEEKTEEAPAEEKKEEGK